MPDVIVFIGPGQTVEGIAAGRRERMIEKPSRS